MNKKDIDTSRSPQDLFADLRSYSIKEILNAGGTTAFAEKMGKHPENIEERLKKLPEDAFLTQEEFEAALNTLDQSK